MNILDFIINKITPLRKSSDFSSYFDVATQTFGVGNIPKNLRLEAAAVIRVEGCNRIFNLDYVAQLCVTPEGKNCLEKVLGLFMGYAATFTNQASQSPYAPWRLAIFFVPTTEFNATVRISADERQNTCFIFIHFGIILQLCDHFNALLCLNQFLPQIGQNSLEQQTDSCKQQWLTKIPSSEIRQELAIHLALVGALNVLFHELAHFYRGHLIYLRVHNKGIVELREVDSPKQVPNLPSNERRLLELDADQFAGKLASHFWRAVDYPVPGPKEKPNEYFHMMFVISAFLTYLLLERPIKTERYYSPIWRTQHFLDFFHKDYISVEPTEKIDEVREKIMDLEFSLLEHLENALKTIGLNNEFSYARLDSETATLLGPDASAFEVLEQKFSPFKPNLYKF